jgi:hypothetical protein
MTLTAGRVLRSGNVKLDGRYQLEVIGAPAGGSRNITRSAGQAPPKVRIIRKESDFAIIEVACGCGEVIQIRCNYAGAKSSGEQPGQENAQEA